MTGRRRVRGVLPLVTVVVASACGFSGLNFEQDDRLTISRPRALATVDMPLTVDWRITGFRVAAPGTDAPAGSGYFGLFFDRAPVGPRRPLSELARDDVACRSTPGCPDEAWFNSRFVFFTTDTTFMIQGLPDTRPRERPQAQDIHEVTIVLIGPDGVRIGESAWTVDFVVDRGQA